jgi:hypothetical protein
MEYCGKKAGQQPFIVVYLQPHFFKYLGLPSFWNISI